MEAHFLSHLVEGEPQFRPEPWYNPHGDCIVCVLADEAVVADRIDEVLTIYRSAVDDRPIGFQIKEVAALIQRFGWDGLAVTTEARGGKLNSVSVMALLLAAYETGPMTMHRRAAYATVMQEPSPKHMIARDELIPA